VFTELRVRVNEEPRYRIPDICVKALPHQVTPILTQPDLAIEIVSPDDEVPEMLAKIGDYLAAGIPHVWWSIRTSARWSSGSGRHPPPRQPVARDALVGRDRFALLFQQLDEPAE